VCSCDCRACISVFVMLACVRACDCCVCALLCLRACMRVICVCVCAHVVACTYLTLVSIWTNNKENLCRQQTHVS